ncbi:MAG: hypothetical protein ACFHXK_03380 [bacterium]
MLAPMKLQHIRMFGVLIMLIGVFLFISMVFIALQGEALLTGIALKMFIAGLAAGGVITALGGALFRYPSLGRLDIGE